MDQGSKSFKHYLISQAINLIWVFLVWVVLLFAVLPEGLQNAMSESFYFFILYIVIAISMYFIFWRPNSNRQKALYVFSIIGGVAGCLFIGLFFGVFFKPLNYSYTKSQGTCDITKINLADFDGSENYAALNVRFTDSNGEVLNGYGCASSKKESSIVSPPYVYSYYEKDESISCGKNDGDGVQILEIESLSNSYYSSQKSDEDEDDDEDDDERRVLQNYEFQQQQYNKTNIDQDHRRSLNESGSSYKKENNLSKTRSSYSSRSRRSRSYSSYRSRSSSSSNSCDYSQNFTDIKLSAWHCIDWDSFVKDVGKNQKILQYSNCYYTIYGNEKDAEENAKNKDLNAQNMKSFYLVTFDEDPYYNKTAFLLIVAFCLVPFMNFTHFSWIPLVANNLEKKCCNSRNQELNDQQNKYVQNEQTDQNELNKQQIQSNFTEQEKQDGYQQEMAKQNNEDIQKQQQEQNQKDYQQYYDNLNQQNQQNQFQNQQNYNNNNYNYQAQNQDQLWQNNNQYQPQYGNQQQYYQNQQFDNNQQYQQNQQQQQQQQDNNLQTDQNKQQQQPVNPML